MTSSLNDALKWAKRRHPGQPEFHQALAAIGADIWPLIEANEAYGHARLFERLCEPDRVLSFRVCWEDDEGGLQINRGYRVQYSNALGPYKGGLRFSPDVSLSVFQFLGFEQCFKNALTGLPMGGGKGGADFDPSGRSDAEIMRFCQAFMSELYRHIGPDLDIPAGDIGVGSREIGYLFGSYKKLTGRFSPVLTGKDLAFGGSPMRTEATGYGLIYFVCRMLAQAEQDLDGKTVAVSGAGNVALHAAEKALDYGAKVVTLSDSGGFIHDQQGLDRDKLDYVRQLKSGDRQSLEACAEDFGAEWQAGEAPWIVPCNIALPCATQNEVNKHAAKTLVDNGCVAVGEGANMPCTADATALFRDAGIMLAPGKAANAGGVALSGLEVTQNITRERRDRDDLANSLDTIMGTIHERCVEEGDKGDGIDYVRGANRAGFKQLAAAMLAYGIQ